jgi:hypothetical protein
MGHSRLETVVVAAACAVSACQPDFTPPSEIHGVRVLAVRQDPASGVPGGTVKLRMLAVDDREPTTEPGGEPTDEPSAAPPLQIKWVGGCNNPPSRQYYACAPALRALGEDPELATSGLVGSGDEFSLTLPDDILSSAPKLASDPVHYGVSYVFFGVCRGQITTDGRDGFPFGCSDDSGAPAGPADFVIGFTTIYAYEGAENQNTNPVLDGVDFDGAPALPALAFDANEATPAPRSCTLDTDCADLSFGHPAVCSAKKTCAPLVSACQGKKCPSYAVLPHVSPQSFESFTGENEIMWTSFYTTLGSFERATRLLDDRVNGPTRDPSSGFQAPAPDPAGARHTSTIWVTVNDQRGGVTWASFEVVAQ